MSCPSPVRIAQSDAIAADFAVSAMPAAAASLNTLGTTGSAPSKVIDPPVEAGAMPTP